MANPSDPEQSEDKESGGVKQKAVTQPCTGGVEKDNAKDNNDVENDGNISNNRLPSTDLSMDARACRRPRPQKSKDSVDDQEQPIKDNLQGSYSVEDEMKKRNNEKEENKKMRHDEDIKNLIKQLVPTPKSYFKFFDATIVYHKNDFENVVHFQEKLIDIAKTEFKETSRIELYDSAEFTQSKIRVVEDVLKSCSVVFVYLTPNFTTGELNLFVEEAIGISRLNLGSDYYHAQNQWVLKPVHTMPRKSRNYKTPVGLLTVNSVDWFDRDSLHTLNNIKGILKTAITQRKQRELEINTSISYNTLFGSPSEMPHLGPPFNKPHESPITPHLTSQHQIDPPQDLMPFLHRSSSSQPLQNFPTHIRTDTQPSYVPGFQYSSNVGPFISRHHDSNTYPPTEMMSQMRLEQSGYQIPPPPYSSIDHGQHLRPSHEFEQRMGQTLSTAKPEYVHHTMEEHEQRFLADQAIRQIPDYHTEAMHQQQQYSIQPTQRIADIQQAPVYPPSIADIQRHNSNDLFPNMYRHVSQDGFPSNQSGNFETDRRENIQPSSRLSISSMALENSLTRTNLSADDDVEVDNNTKSNSDIHERTRHSQHDDDDVDESEVSSAESDSSSDSDSDCYEGARVIEKVVKIYKCKNVQLGEGNVVKEIDKKPERKVEGVKKQPKTDTSKNDKSFENIPVTSLPQNVLSTPGMNISISEDDMSMANTASGGNCHKHAGRILSSKKTLHLETTSNIPQASFETSQQKPNAQLKMSVGNKDTSFDTSTRFANVFSPEDNCTEDELFGSGSVSTNSLSSGSAPSSTVEAPFSFSQGIQQSRNIRKLILPMCIDRNKNREDTFDNDISGNSEEELD